MTYTTLNDPSMISGTSYQGSIDISYNELVAKLGQPILGSGDGKVQAEWIVSLAGGTIITIYDYKDNKTPNQIREWHIGGKKPENVATIKNILGLK